MRLEARTPGLPVKHFTSEPRGTPIEQCCANTERIISVYPFIVMMVKDVNMREHVREGRNYRIAV